MFPDSKEEIGEKPLLIVAIILFIIGIVYFLYSFFFGHGLTIMGIVGMGIYGSIVHVVWRSRKSHKE